MSHPTIYFSHANGLPATTYQYLFDLLWPHSIQAVEKYGHGQFKVDSGWKNLSLELMDFMDRKGEQGSRIGIGHSLGANITILTAIQQPKRFQKIILLEPPLVALYKRLIIQMFNFFGQAAKIVPHAKKAKVRRYQFNTRQEARDYFSQKRMFQRFHPKSFEAYIEYGLKQVMAKDSAQISYELAFAREVEYQIFSSLPLLAGRYPLEIPAYLIYGTQSDVLGKEDIQSLKRTFPTMEFIAMEGGHLFPLEQPEKTAELILSILAK